MSGAAWCAAASVLGALGLAGAAWVVLREGETGPVTLGFLGLVASSVLLIGWAGLAARRRARRPALAAAWLGAVLLVALAIVSGFTVGGLFLPGAITGFVGASKLTGER